MAAMVVQHCHSDARIKSALQAWCAYGAQGTDPPADLYKRGDPLRRAFAAKDERKLTQDRAGSTLGGVKGEPPTAFSKPAGVSQVGVSGVRVSEVGVSEAGGLSGRGCSSQTVRETMLPNHIPY